MSFFLEKRPTPEYCKVYPFTIEEYRQAVVVREDLLPGGSKARFVPYLVAGAKEVVYGGPCCGAAALALSIYCESVGIKTTLFYAQRKRENWHGMQLKAEARGASIVEIPGG